MWRFWVCLTPPSNYRIPPTAMPDYYKVVSKYRLHFKAVLSAKNALSLSLLWKFSFPFSSSPQRGMNSFPLWIPWAICTIIPLTLFYLVLFLFSYPIYLCSARPSGPGKWGLGHMYSLVSPLSSSPPPAPGIYSAVIEELNCGTLWISS